MTQRANVEFPSGQRGERCRGWLYEPEGNGPFPVIVMAHGLGGVKEMRLDAFAERFSDAGYACLVFDYRNFGASEGAPRQLLDIGQQLEDWSSAIAFARLQPSLMRSKVVLWGTSFGGGHVIASAARDQNVAAAIAQCPFTDGIASALAMDLRSSFKVTAMAMVDMLRGLVGMTPLMVATSGPPHSAALMTAPDAHGGYLALVPSGVSFRNHVAARFALNILRYRPGRRAAKVSCPILFCICETDSVAPAGPTRRYAKKAPRGEVRLYRAGHFDIYVGEAFERVVTDQLDFLKRHVPVKGRAMSKKETT
ncbi:Quorum-quenching protein AidA [Ralstonia edaphis]|uniref:alpha/beta hydrolase n=1 Tax=Ralstonia edaphi TaxID=3058599 RepID=UPI0028F61091|nr:alpha/beta fold hydrolase [Ralstonia sp. LMG 6871]CAJ0704680.1 Quorum-quenching protein AidA [Ralstonia sp. LMG 6871]